MDKGKVYFPMNFGSGNRGCEAIVRGTSAILSLSRSDTVLYDLNSEEVQLDKSLGVDELGMLVAYSENSVYNIGRRIVHKTLNKLGINVFLSSIYPYTEILKSVSENDVILLSGGDLYCYEYHLRKNTEFVKELKKRKKETKVVLWAASLEEKLLDESAIEGLRLLDKITVRETLTQEALLHLGVSDNVELYPDPAFVLDAEPIELPHCFSESDVFGINVSNYVNGGSVALTTNFSENLKKLIDYVLEKTELQILLVPHVIWGTQDDRIICSLFYDMYKDTGRVHILDMVTMRYCQIRYIISKCRFFMGARTHSVISAYSMCVPAIALGYSVKARGIAKDLMIPSELVVDSKNLSGEKTLLNAFEFLVSNENSIRELLKHRMPDYIKSALKAKEAMKGILD